MYNNFFILKYLTDSAASDYSHCDQLVGDKLRGAWHCSFLSHTSDINDLLEGLDGVLEYWFDRLHDSESSFHIVDLWLHAFDGFHLSGNFDKWLSIIESLEDSGGKSFLDVLDGGGLGNGGVSISSGFA